ncbi:hypothetical protein Tco_0425948 [Tanacetum coccineum]
MGSPDHFMIVRGAPIWRREISEICKLLGIIGGERFSFQPILTNSRLATRNIIVPRGLGNGPIMSIAPMSKISQLGWSFVASQSRYGGPERNRRQKIFLAVRFAHDVPRVGPLWLARESQRASLTCTTSPDHLIRTNFKQEGVQLQK